VLLAHRWIVVDMRKAFDRAVAQHHVVHTHYRFFAYPLERVLRIRKEVA
jgi:hypothetical protein